ncbi:DUF922 domain-containing protein [Succinimonas amylolytica]|uniref:DUF922 domain-containing protein n=1 Tax=Succinimonas amylolytica TaxID=83769 RepID=UPI000379A8C7|nr:DUF922 domain-containing protein [Succinimonas amylolytica]
MMRKTLLALLIVGVPLALVYAFLFILPQFVNGEKEHSVLDERFATVVGDTVLPNIANNAVGHNSRADQVLRYNKEHGDHSEDVFYHDLDVREHVNRNTSFYDVSADTPEELHDIIESSAPLNVNTNKRSIVKVSYAINWNLDVRQEPEQCEFYGADITVDITTVMPNWTEVRNQAPEVQEQWSRYLADASHYSSRHDPIIIKASKSLAQRIRYVGKQRFCSDLIEAVNAMGDASLVGAEKMMARYKSETGNGRLMGVQVPVFAQSNYIKSLDEDDEQNL